MENLKFVDLFQENKIHKILNNLPQNQKVIKAGSIKTESLKHKKQPHDLDTEPEIKLQKKGDVVELITITCGCGRETQIVLEYENNGNSGNNMETNNKPTK